MDALKQIAAFAGPGYSELHWRSAKKAYYPVDGEITDDVIRAHLDGAQPIGINMNIGDDKTHLAVFDLDDHDGLHQDSVVQVRVGFIAAALHQMGTPYFVVRSGSGRGYHVWIAFANAARMDVVRDRMRDVLDTANRILANSPWGGTEKFVPDDGQGKGLFHDTGKVVEKHRERDFTLQEHHVELLPKGGKRPVVALPLALKSVVMTPTEIADSGAMQFEEGGDLVVTKALPRKSGPKSGQHTKAVDEAAALRAFMAVRPGGGYKAWTDGGFNIFGAFGEDGFDHWLAYSKEADGFVSEKDVRDKWADISKAKGKKSGKEPFWAYARQGGYTGGLPDGVNLSRKGDATKAILEDVVSSLKLFRDGDGTSYARVGPRRVLRIDSIEFSDWLRRIAYEAGTTPSQDQINLVVSTARAHAYESIEDVHLRVAKVGGEIFIDLADADDRIMVLSADGARLIEGDDECPVVFRRSKQLPLRFAEGTLDDIRAMVNMDDDQFVVFMACAVKMFFSDTPSPIVNLTGEYGSAKTSTTRVMRTLIDPVTAMVAPASDKADDMLIRSWHNYVLTLENMSDLTKLSDTLCGICTGMGFEVRQLFTNGDLFSLWVRRPVIVNGIDPSKYAADLISRMVEIELVKPARRMLESEFEERLKESAPRMFGGAARLVVEVLKLLPEIDPHEFAENVRLAEFGAVGEAVARVMGKEPGWFVDKMVEAQEDAQAEAADDSMTMRTVEAMQEAIARHGKFFDTPQVLLDELRKVAESLDWSILRLPQTAATLGRELNQLKPALRKRGWEIEKRDRKWLIVPPKSATEEELEAMMAKHR